MAMTNYESVDAYIATQSEPVQRVLHQVRRAIRKAVPAAEEMISYKMPAYKLGAARLLFFAGWKEHFSLYPATEGVVAAFKSELAPYEVNKGTIRFPLSEPVPVDLIGRIAQFRAREVHNKTRAPKKK